MQIRDPRFQQRTGVVESSLNLQYQQLTGEVGEFLGYGRGALNADPAWSVPQQKDIDFCVASGMRVFYFSSAYDWSFLKPVASLQFLIGTQTVLLPDDYSAPEGRVTLLTTSTTSMPWRIEWRNEGALREMYSVSPSITGPPMYVAEQVLKGTGGMGGQQKQLFLFPTADQTYTLQLEYWISPDYLSGAFPYAYGGAAHAETLLESCLAIAEQRRDDAMSVHTQKFQALLTASIAYDRKNKPEKLGPNRDRSDDVGWNRQNVHWWAPAATYNGGSFN